MKKLFEIDINEDYRRAIISQYFLMIFTFILSIIVRTHEKTIIQFGFIIELILFGLLFKFYFHAQKHRNYAYWGISFLILIFIIKNILHYTFIDYNIFILYISFLAGIFLAINSYVMSSPLFYPRVQWWEYDFRYRGDLKALVKEGDKTIEGRLTDLRRGTGCVEIFDYLELEKEIILEVDFKKHVYILKGIVKTNKMVIPGRPIRHGIKFDLSDEQNKNTYHEIKKVWDDYKKAKLRDKFSKVVK